MDSYRLILPNEKAQTYQYVTLFILILNFLLFGFIYFNAVDARIVYTSLGGTVLCVFIFTLIFISRRKKKQPAFRVEIFFFLLSICWLLTDRYLLALCILCFAVIGHYAHKKFEVVFTEAKIIYPSFPVKIFLWKDVANVVLKDGMLTIDLKNNRLIQVVVTKESAVMINEDSFNLFCKKLLV